MENNMQLLISSFENIKQEKNWFEYWSARVLQKLLWYIQWRNFENIIEKAKISCEEAWNKRKDHFANISKPLIL